MRAVRWTSSSTSPARKSGLAETRARQHGLSRTSFTPAARRVVCVVHPDLRTAVAKAAAPLGWTLITARSAISACSEAMKRASAEQSPLLLLHGRVDVSGEAVAVMRQALDRDPMFGCAAARTRCSTVAVSDGRRADSLPEHGFRAGRSPTRRTWRSAPNCSSRRLLLSPAIVAEFGPLDERFSTLPGAIVHYLSRARRCGYRTVLANRAVVAARGASCHETAEPCFGCNRERRVAAASSQS